MKNWRPATKCIYVIPEIHGSYNSFNIILNRILPLRFSKDHEDKLILLGDYVDHGSDSYQVIESIIKISKDNDITALMGNHEFMMLRAIYDESVYNDWVLNGGAATIDSYLKANNLKSNSFTFPFSRLKDIIPSTHIDFLESLQSHFKYDKYIFFHGGIDLNNPEQTSHHTFVSDIISSKKFKISTNYLQESISKIYVGAHNFKSKLPYITSRYLMLGGSTPQRLLLFELNSMKCSMVKFNKSRFYNHIYKKVI